MSDSNSKTYRVTTAIEELFDCNHEEADSRLVLHAIIDVSDVVVVAKDTDVLVLMVWGYAKSISLFLPTIHALTGCDTTSFFYRVGKVRILKKLFKNPEQCTLLSGLYHDEVLDVGTI